MKRVIERQINGYCPKLEKEHSITAIYNEEGSIGTYQLFRSLSNVYCVHQFICDKVNECPLIKKAAE